ncbi:MAG: LysM peptidoglycan-binding domain-containing protein [Anaeromyxobacter sp.]
MKRHLLSGLLAASAAVAVAQTPAEPPAPAAPAPAEAPAPDAVEVGSMKMEEGRGALPPPDTYTIRPGDTLWDLSGRFLNNPWYWPKVWSYNPEIENPHWIYPGNLLRFYPSEDQAPVRVEPVAGAEPQAPAAEEQDWTEPPPELEDFSKADMKAPESEESRDTVAVAGPYKIGYAGPKSALVRHDAFVTPRELAESGAIRAAAEEKLLLATLDRAYARFDQAAPVKVGESYVIYKTLRAVRHPVTKELFGYQTVVLGTAKVTAVDEKAATLQIQQAFDPIERGALLGPMTERTIRRVDRRPNERQLDGYIIGGQVPVLSSFGENHVVFLDRGSADGVQEGNTFKVVRAGDPYGAKGPIWDPRLPVESVGELLVVDVKERASAAVVLRSLREVVVGDRIEMRPNGG